MLRIEHKFKNGTLFNAIMSEFQSVPEAAKKIGVSYPSLLELLTLKKKPVDSRFGELEYTDTAKKIAEYFGQNVVALFPTELYELPTPCSVVEVPLNYVRAFIDGCNPEAKAIDEERKEEINRSLKSLSPREEKVIRARFGIDDGREKTLAETGAMLNVTGGRANQIEQRALRKLRHPSLSRHLKPFLASDF